MEPSDEELLGLMPQQLRDDLATVARMAAHGAGPDVTPELFEGSLATGALQFARAVLARYGHRPSPPAEGEVVKAVRPSRRQLIMLADDMGMASVSEAAEYARAVLARWGHQPAPHAEGEVAELTRWLRMQGEAQKPGPNSLLSDRTKKEHHAAGVKLTRAADLLEQRHPAPVPVSERLPSASHVYFEFVISDADDCTQAGGIAPTYAQALSEGQHYLAQYQQDGPHTLELRRVEVLPPGALPVPQGKG